MKTMAADKKSIIWILFCVLFIFAVSAAITEKLLRVPLVEVSGLWFSAVKDVTFSFNLFEAMTTFPDFYSEMTYIYFSLLILFTVLLHQLYKLFVRPLNRIRYVSDVGYLEDGRLSKKEIANMVQQRRMVGEIPPVYPNGWFGLIESFMLKKSQSLNISVLGLNLAVFRDDKGQVHAINAYCPHMGANLAAGGRVFGDCLECPFHGWRFRGTDGKCTHIPYTDTIPDVAKVKSWTVVDLNGWIYLWHHAEGIEPNWKLPEIEQITRGEWTYRGRSEHHINAHIEEIPENGADVYHLSHVHGPIMFAGIDLRYMYTKLWEFMSHEWTAVWEQQPPPNGHIGSIVLTHSMKLFGQHLPPIDLTVKGQQIGPAVVYLWFESMFGRGAFVQSLTPTGPMMQKLVHNIYFQVRTPTIVAKFFMYSEAVQVERDIMIWNNKCYQAKPVFVKSKEDTLISKHRRWYQQFYSENSPRFKFQKDTMDW